MNARKHVIDINCDFRQVEDCASCLFHTILFHRCLGKFKFNEDRGGQQTIVIGSVGYEDVDCKTVDLSYVRCSSPQLKRAVSSEVAQFVGTLQPGAACASATISLEFFEKRPRVGGLSVMGHDKLPWEIWVLKFSIIQVNSEAQRQRVRHDLASALSDKMLLVVDAMNRYEYVPKNPQREELDLVFDTSFTDVQPYLFRISPGIVVAPSQSVSQTMGRFIRDALEM